jgi:hypothetical protein
VRYQEKHETDEDCIRFDEFVDGVCNGCGVSWDGPPCPVCEKVAFHDLDCPELEDEN